MNSNEKALIIGKWYWISYEVKYFEQGRFMGTYWEKELKQCLDCYDTSQGMCGVFNTDEFGPKDILTKHIFPYNGPMKKQFIFWGKQVPDV